MAGCKVRRVAGCEVRRVAGHEVRRVAARLGEWPRGYYTESRLTECKDKLMCASVCNLHRHFT